MDIVILQQAFPRLLGQLFSWVYANDYSCTLGEAWRSPETCDLYAAAKKGNTGTNSLHPLRLAIDLNIFKSGKMIFTKEDYEPIGSYWKSLSDSDITCCWGGDFMKYVNGQLLSNPDSDHFSLEYNGRK